MLKQLAGPGFVGLAAFLWATDTLFRYPVLDACDPILIVLFEHVLATILLGPYVIYTYGFKLFQIGTRNYLAAAFCGAGGSAMATVLFTASFLYLNPSVALLLQKLQPFIVVVIAAFFLGERPTRAFYVLGTIAVGAASILSIPHFTIQGSYNLRGIGYCLGAAALWAASTVTGTNLVRSTPVVLAVFWRFFFGLLALGAFVGLSHTPIHSLPLQALPALTYLSLFPGLLAMLVYYQGLTRTRASVSTFIELFYPIGAVALNALFLGTTLSMHELIAGGLLIICVLFMSFQVR